MKIHSVRAELFHADRQTDMTKVIITFHNFANVLKNQNTPSVTQSPSQIIIFAATYVFVVCNQ